MCMCLVCGLLAICVFVFIGYHYLVASSTDERIEYHKQDIDNQAAMSANEASDSSSVPASVMSKVDDVLVLSLIHI